jgi:hypothetical protein
MYKILNEEQQGLWETLASMSYPQLLLINNINNSDDDEDE